MFGNPDSGSGLAAGEAGSQMVDTVSGVEAVPVVEPVSGIDPFSDGFDDMCFGITEDELAAGWVVEDRDLLPDLDSLPVGSFLAVVVDHVDRSRLNGFDLVRLVRARERLVAHAQAGVMADMVEMAYAAHGGPDSGPGRLVEAFEYAADELRPALTLTRRSAEYRLSLASDVVERLPRVWELFDAGLIDLGKVRAFSNGTAHVSVETARLVVDRLADVAPGLTVGQLRRRIRKLCVGIDPEDAVKREKTGHEERRLVIEPTPDGLADLHLLGMKLAEARAIGRRVNGYMISLQREDRSGRSHDQLRHDIARDLLLGEAGIAGVRGGLVDIHVPASALDGGTEPGEIGGMGPVTAEAARQVVAELEDAEHRITVVDDDGNPTHVYTPSRRATRQIRRFIQAVQPTCTFPGCVAPAIDCDYDHRTPWARGGETSTTNLDPKCDHDHQLKDIGWAHQHHNGQDTWTSPHGHTYTTSGRSP